LKEKRSSLFEGKTIFAFWRKNNLRFLKEKQSSQKFLPQVEKRLEEAQAVQQASGAGGKKPGGGMKSLRSLTKALLIGGGFSPKGSAPKLLIQHLI
jgi:hypothetical protein